MKKSTIVVLAIFLVTIVSSIGVIAFPERPSEVPSPPPTATDSPDKDTLERERQERQDPNLKPLPTGTPYVGQEPQPPLIDPSLVVDTEILKPAEAYAPSDTWITYNDTNYGFSFEYPENWIVSPPDKGSNGQYAVYIVSITNFDPTRGMTKGGDNYSKVQITVIDDPTAKETVDERLKRLFHPETELREVANVNGKVEGLRQWIANGPTISGDLLIAAILKDSKLYELMYTPVEMPYKEAVERVISSFSLN